MFFPYQHIRIAPCSVRNRLCPFVGLLFIDKYMGGDNF
jgi:hypothetical protein